MQSACDDLMKVLLLGAPTAACLRSPISSLTLQIRAHLEKHTPPLTNLTVQVLGFRWASCANRYSSGFCSESSWLSSINPTPPTPKPTTNRTKPPPQNPSLHCFQHPKKGRPLDFPPRHPRQPSRRARAAAHDARRAHLHQVSEGGVWFIGPRGGHVLSWGALGSDHCSVRWCDVQCAMRCTK